MLELERKEKRMSKLMKKYLDLKKEEASSIYIFRIGIFYNILNEDAKILNEKLGLKLTSLSPEIIKCGFPISSLEKYTKKMDNLQIKYKVIDDLPKNTNITDYSKNIEVKKILKTISEADLNNMKPVEALNFLMLLQEKIKSLN